MELSHVFTNTELHTFDRKSEVLLGRRRGDDRGDENTFSCHQKSPGN